MGIYVMMTACFYYTTEPSAFKGKFPSWAFTSRIIKVSKKFNSKEGYT